MGKIVKASGARVSPEVSGYLEIAATRPTSFFSDGITKLWMKWSCPTDTKGYRQVMIGGVQLDCEGCPMKVRHAIRLTKGVLDLTTDMKNGIVYVMGKNMSMAELRKNVKMESYSADILDILPWKNKH